MYTMYWYDYSDWSLFNFHIPEPVGLPKPKRIIGHRRRYHDTTIPPLDFRSCFVSRFRRSEDQNCARESSAGDSSRLDERVR